MAYNVPFVKWLLQAQTFQREWGDISEARLQIPLLYMCKSKISKVLLKILKFPLKNVYLLPY